MSERLVSKFDDEYVICPYCEEQHGDAWEWCTHEHPEVMTCENCRRRFKYSVQFDATYIADPIKGEMERVLEDAENGRPGTE